MAHLFSYGWQPQTESPTAGFVSGIHHIQKEHTGYPAESVIEKGYRWENIHSTLKKYFAIGLWVLMLRTQLCSMDTSCSEGTCRLSCRIYYSCIMQLPTGKSNMVVQMPKLWNLIFFLYIDNIKKISPAGTCRQQLQIVCKPPNILLGHFKEALRGVFYKN